MTAKLISNENNKATYTVELDWKKFEDEVEKAYKRLRGRFQIPGFRKGKAPRKLIEANYGPEVFYEDALNGALPELLEKASKELQLKPIGRPDIDLEDMDEGKPIVIKVTTELRPVPELGDYKSIEVEKQEVKVSDEDVENEVKREQEKNAVVQPVEDRPAKDGDKVNIDYSGSVDGVKFDGGTAQGQDLTLGSGQFIPGFEEQVEGHSIGEEFDINVKFPEDYHSKDLAGKDAVFTVKINSISEKEIPEADDDFAQDVSEFDTIAEYKDSIRKKLEESAQEAAKANMENAAIEELINISKVDLPQALIDEQVDVEIRNMANQLSQMGIGLDQYLKYTGGDLEALKAQKLPLAKMRLSGDLVLESLIAEQKIDATEEEVEKKIRELAGVYGAKDEDKFLEEVKAMGSRDMFKEDLLKHKAIDYLMSQVKLVDPKPAEEKKEKAESKKKKETKKETKKVTKKTTKKETEEKDQAEKEK